jgi:hypothetical protein
MKNTEGSGCEVTCGPLGSGDNGVGPASAWMSPGADVSVSATSAVLSSNYFVAPTW